MDKTQILDKIEKLQSMQTSSNPNEVKQATMLIERLMRKYNIENNQLNKINTKAIGVEKRTIQLQFSLKNWVRHLGDTLAELYECKMTFKRFNRQLNFLGFTPDVDICAEMFKLVYKSTMDYAWKNIHGTNTQETIKLRNSWYFGFSYGLDKQIKYILAEKQKNERGLILAKEAAINKELEDIKEVNLNLPDIDIHTFSKGVAHGKSFQLTEQLKGEEQ